jgi:hypothetical protein
VSDASHLAGELRQVLILAENHGNVILVFAGETDDIESEANINTLFLADQYGRMSCRLANRRFGFGTSDDGRKS